MMMTETWTVRLDARVRPIIERIAFEEGRDAAQTVRYLLDRALAQRATNMRPTPMLNDTPLAQRRA